MIISELIEILKKEDQNKRVVLSGYEGGYNDVSRIIEIDLVLNVHKGPYYGNHDTPCRTDDPIESCIHISEY